jgi:hypothetical protein
MWYVREGWGVQFGMCLFHLLLFCSLRPISDWCFINSGNTLDTQYKLCLAAAEELLVFTAHSCPTHDQMAQGTGNPPNLSSSTSPPH